MKDHPILFSVIVIAVIVVLMSAAVMSIAFFSSNQMPGFTFGERIALIDIEGTLQDGEAVTRLLHNYGKESSVKAIILRINSPGGGVAPAQEIYREIERVRQNKPTVAYLMNVAASGGYYVASAANKIVASPGTLTGSIGVIMQFPNVEELTRKIGVTLKVVKAGKYKDIGSPLRPMSPEEEQMLNQLVEDVHNQFIEDVAKGRRLDAKDVREIADGRIFTGRQAERLGLVDQLGNFQDAVNVAKQLADIKGEARLLKSGNDTPSVWDSIFRSAVRSVLKELEVRSLGVRAIP